MHTRHGPRPRADGPAGHDARASPLPRALRADQMQRSISERAHAYVTRRVGSAPPILQRQLDVARAQLSSLLSVRASLRARAHATARRHSKWQVRFIVAVPRALAAAGAPCEHEYAVRCSRQQRARHARDQCARPASQGGVREPNVAVAVKFARVHAPD